MRDNPLVWLLLTCVAVMVVAWLSIGRAQAQEYDPCLVLWSAALTSRAMAEEGVPHGQMVGVLRRVYPGIPSVALAELASNALEASAPARAYADFHHGACERERSTPRPRPAPLGA